MKMPSVIIKAPPSPPAIMGQTHPESSTRQTDPL
jgi:hypothetical protein